MREFLSLISRQRTLRPLTSHLSSTKYASITRRDDLTDTAKSNEEIRLSLTLFVCLLVLLFYFKLNFKQEERQRIYGMFNHPW